MFGYRNLFRVLIVETCVHIVHPDGRLIPLDTYNLFYRDDLETTRLAPLRAWAER